MVLGRGPAAINTGGKDSVGQGVAHSNRARVGAICLNNLRIVVFIQKTLSRHKVDVIIIDDNYSNIMICFRFTIICRLLDLLLRILLILCMIEDGFVACDCPGAVE